MELRNEWVDVKALNELWLNLIGEVKGMSKNKEIELVMSEYRSGCAGTGNDKTNEIINCLNDIVARVGTLEKRIKALEHITARRIAENVNL